MTPTRSEMLAMARRSIKLIEIIKALFAELGANSAEGSAACLRLVVETCRDAGMTAEAIKSGKTARACYLEACAAAWDSDAPTEKGMQ